MGEFARKAVRKGLEMRDETAKSTGAWLYSRLPFGRPDVSVRFADTQVQAAGGVHSREWGQLLRESDGQSELAGCAESVAEAAARAEGTSNGEGGDSAVMSAKGTSSILSGISVLVVEDNVLVGDLFRMHLQSHGARVLGPATSVGAAFALLDRSAAEIDVAVLDVDLNGELVTPIAQRLMVTGTPFLFVTALGALDPLPAELHLHRRLEKPSGVAQLAAELAALVGR